MFSLHLRHLAGAGAFLPVLLARQRIRIEFLNAVYKILQVQFMIGLVATL
jgi:hypothetical protein